MVLYRRTYELDAGRWLLDAIPDRQALDADRPAPTVLRRPSWDDRLALAWMP